MPRSLAAAAVLLAALVPLSACGSDGASPGGTPASSGSGSGAEPLVIEITVTGQDITPNGDRLDVAVGQPIELDVTADAPGEIHVHSSPEQEFEYAAGTQTFELDPITAPGVVDIESHTLEKTIVQLEVK